MFRAKFHGEQLDDSMRQQENAQLAEIPEVDDDENGGDGNITGSCVTGARDLALAEASTPPGPTHHHLHHHHHHQ